MDKMDVILLWILVALSFAAAALRVLLAKKQGKPNSRFWTVQEFVFPVLLLAALILFQSGTADVVLELVLVGLVEEIVCVFLRRRSRKKTE